MRRLFDEKSNYTEESMELCQDAGKVLEPIFKKYIARGYCIRDIAHVIQSELTMIECLAVTCPDTEEKSADQL